MINPKEIEDNVKYFSLISLIGLLIGIYGLHQQNYVIAIISIAFLIWFNLKASISEMKQHQFKQYSELIKHLQFIEDKEIKYLERKEKQKEGKQ